jgi:nitrite reductase/ring-hydroxylating ferredoxin subunit
MLINKVVADIDEGGRFLGERFDEDEVHIVCPWHGWEYVLPTGECAAAPGLGLKRIPVTIDDGRIYLAIPSES